MTIVKKIQCVMCNGIGLLKNHNFYCSKCKAYKCEFTINLSKEDFYKYKLCEFCNEYNSSVSSSGSGSGSKTHCDKCLGNGYYSNTGVICNNCKSSHHVCNCITNPYAECPKCIGLGIIE